MNEFCGWNLNIWYTYFDWSMCFWVLLANVTCSLETMYGISSIIFDSLASCVVLKDCFS